jgi:hypothetical protein
MNHIKKVYSCVSCPFYRPMWDAGFVYCGAQDGSVDNDFISVEMGSDEDRLMQITRHPRCPFNTGDSFTYKFGQ